MYDGGHGPDDSLHEIELQHRFAQWQAGQPYVDDALGERFSIRTALLTVLDLLFYAIFAIVGLAACATAYAFVAYTDEIGLVGIAAAIVASLLALLSFVIVLRVGGFNPEQRVGHRSVVLVVLLIHEAALMAVWLTILGLAA